MRRLHAPAYLALVALLAIACASAPRADLTPTQDLWQRYGPGLEAAAEVYEQTPPQALAAKRAGSITGEQLAAIMQGCDLLRIATETAAASVRTAVLLRTAEAEGKAASDYVKARRELATVLALKVVAGLAEAAGGTS